MADRALVGAASLFAAATAVGAAVSLHHDLDGEPLGLRPPLPVRDQLLLGLGAAVSAPWPMPVAALTAAALDRPGPAARRICTAVGVSGVLGTLVEPVTWGRRARGPAVAASIALNLLACAALAAAARRAARPVIAPGSASRP